MSGIAGEELRHHRREVGGRRIEEQRIALHLDAGRLEGGEVGRDRRLAERVVLRADHRRLQLRPVLRQPFDAGDVVDRMHLAGRDERRRLRREVARQQRGDQHALARGDRLDARPRIAAQHHDELHAVFLDQLGGAGARLAGVVFLVIGDELDLVRLAADLDAAGLVHPVGPDLAAVEAGLAPGRDRPGQRRQEADLHDLVLREGDFRGMDVLAISAAPATPVRNFLRSQPESICEGHLHPPCERDRIRRRASLRPIGSAGSNTNSSTSGLPVVGIGLQS